MARQDNPKCLSGYVLWINVLLKLGFIWTIFFSPSICQDAVVLECPAVFRNGENLIYCTVNTTALTEAGCTGVGAVIGFQITLPGQSPLTTCDADLNNCVSTFNSDGCRCVSHASGLKRYQLNFTGDSSVHTNGSFDCVISCLPGSPPPTVKDPSCDPIDFTVPTMPPTTATTAAPTTPPPNTTSEPPGTTTASTESPSSNTATSGPTTQHTGNNSPSEAATETTGNVSSATTASSEPSVSPSSISGPTTTSTENSSTNNTTGNVGSTTGPASDLALYAGLGFMGLVCLVGIVVVIVLIVRRRKRRKDIATNSGNHSSPDQSGENNYTYINNTAL